MRKLTSAITIALALTACQQDSPRNEANAARAASPANLKISARHQHGQGGTKIDVSTNLPNGARLMATLLNSHDRVIGQDDGSVSGGAISFGPFSNEGTPWGRGNYTAEISAPLSDLQPSYVRSRVGAGYSNFTSPFLITSKVSGGTILEYPYSFTIP